MHPPEETREQRKQLTRRAVSEVVRERIAALRLRKSTIAYESGISRSYLRALLRAEKTCTLFVYLELSDALTADAAELLKDVLDRREQLRSLR